MKNHKQPDYPNGLTGEEANELIVMAEHNIANRSDQFRTNKKVAIQIHKATLNEWKQDLLERTNKKRRRDTILAWVILALVFIGVVAVIGSVVSFICG